MWKKLRYVLLSWGNLRFLKKNSDLASKIDRINDHTRL